MRRNHWIRRIIVIFALYLAVCAIGGIYLADGTIRPGRRDLSEEESASFRLFLKQEGMTLTEAAITTPDGAVLKAWLVRPAHPNGDAALLLHGLGDNRLGMNGYAHLLLAHGYTVLLPDARGHGTSGGDLVTYGLLEAGDIHQWVDYLEAATHPHCVYGLGESMGAAELLQSLQVEKRFCAVVAESPFSTFPEIAYDRMGQPFGLGPWMGRVVLRPLVEVAFLRARWKFGLDMKQISPENAVADSHTPVLLIHGQIDSNIPLRHSQAIHERTPENRAMGSASSGSLRSHLDRAAGVRKTCSGMVRASATTRSGLGALGKRSSAGLHRTHGWP
jgi:pimeloyl-ACP methyl ester carboxylesterase